MATQTTIFEAIVSGDVAAVKRKLARDPGALAERDADGLTPLLLALYHDRQEIVEVILVRDPPLDVHEAAALGRVDALAALLRRSTRRATEFSRDGFTPLHLAAYFDRPDAASLLLGRGAEIDARSTNPRLTSMTPLHSAAAGGSTGVAAILLDHGADPNATQPGGWTALHQAAANGNLGLCRALLEHEADPAPMADDRSRPLDFAIENGHQEIVELLKPPG